MAFAHEQQIPPPEQPPLALSAFPSAMPSGSTASPFTGSLEQSAFFDPIYAAAIEGASTQPPPDSISAEATSTPSDFDVSFDLRMSNGESLLPLLPSQDMEAWSTIMQDCRYFSFPDMSMDQDDMNFNPS